MAIYHCAVQVIKRNDGRSAVAAAAYRSGECITNEYDGIEHDYTKKNWVKHTEIILPENAPKEYRDRSALWNAVETVEKAQDSQLAREFELALPKEMTLEQQIDVAKSFARNLVSEGMIVDICIHNPPKTNDRHQPIDIYGNVTKDIKKMIFENPHVHMLGTMRPLDREGNWQKKSEIEYLCKNSSGAERAFTAAEFRKAKEYGWEKQYRYYDGDKKLYYTAAEAKDRNLERVNRSPKTTPYGRKNETVERWNSKDMLIRWREQWEQVVNDKFISLGSDVRIDHRSFKDQGREDEMPTIHMGPAAINMEKRAGRLIREGKSEQEVTRSDIGDINRQIREYNRFVRDLKARFEFIAKKAKGVVDEIANKIETLRARLIGNKYKETVFTRKYRQMESVLEPEADRLDKYQEELQKVDDANKKSSDMIKQLQKALKACSPLQIKKKSEIQKTIRDEQGNIEYRSEYMQSVGQKYQIASEEDYDIAARKHEQRVDHYNRLGNAIEAIREDSAQILDEYNEAVDQVSNESEQDVHDKRMEIRLEAEATVKEELSKKQGDAFDEHVFDSSIKAVDRMLNSDDSGNALKKTVKKSRRY